MRFPPLTRIVGEKKWNDPKRRPQTESSIQSATDEFRNSAQEGKISRPESVSLLSALTIKLMIWPCGRLTLAENTRSDDVQERLEPSLSGAGSSGRGRRGCGEKRKAVNYLKNKNGDVPKI